MKQKAKKNFDVHLSHISDAMRLEAAQYPKHGMNRKGRFPFVGVIPYLDMYCLFCAETMHAFHVGLSRMLNDVAAERLCCNTDKRDHYKILKRTVRTFSSLLTDILRK